MIRIFILFFIIFCQSTFAQIDSITIRINFDTTLKKSISLFRSGALEEGMLILKDVDSIAQLHYGLESVEYSNVAFYQGFYFYSNKDFNSAIKWFTISKKIRENKLGLKDLEYLLAINALANCYFYLADFIKAELIYEQVANGRKEILGKKHKDYISSINNLANFYRTVGKYEKAEILYLEIANYRLENGGKQTIDYAWAAHNLGYLYLIIENFEQSEIYFKEALEIRGRLLENKHVEYLSSLNSLANLYQTIGEYNDAERLNLESKAIWESSLDTINENYALVLNSLAGSYLQVGNFNKALPLFQKALRIINQSAGENSPYSFSLQNNVATIYLKLKNFDLSEKMAIDNKVKIEKAYGKLHDEYLTTQLILLSIYTSTKKYEKADKIFIESIDEIQKNKNANSNLYAHLFVNYSNVLMEKRNLGEAKIMCLKAKSILLNTRGANHTDYLQCIQMLNQICINQKSFDETEVLYLEISKIQKMLIEGASKHLSEAELGEFINVFKKQLDGILSFVDAVANPKNMYQEIVNQAFDNTLFFKGYLLNSISRMKNLAKTNASTDTLFNSLKSYSRRLGSEYSKPISEQDSIQILTLNDNINTLEKQIARKMNEFSDVIQQVSWKQVSNKLNASELAIEFVNFKVLDSMGIVQDSVRYGALLIHAQSKEVTYVPLCSEKEIIKQISIYTGQKRINKLYSSRGANPIQMQVQEGLYNLIWKPLEKYLIDFKTIYFSPIGLLHNINLSALPTESNNILADIYDFYVLNSTRSLVLEVTKPIKNDYSFLFGGIIYDYDSTINSAIPGSGFGLTKKSNYLSLQKNQRLGVWNFLPGTEVEINSLETIMKKYEIKVEKKIHQSATESAFKNIGFDKGGTPRIIHIATHGFFFPDPKEIQQSVFESHKLESAFKMSDHPMIRSGLILAGGNYAWKEGKPFNEGMEDGILTAYEISQMNLSNTELVVLSACETGLGDIQGNEGVYGLQRAFKIAGAKYLMMSLWQVPDEETKEFMISFYKNWLNEKLSIPDAFRNTQKEMREKYVDPYLWAGFVLVE